MYTPDYRRKNQCEQDRDTLGGEHIEEKMNGVAAFWGGGLFGFGLFFLMEWSYWV